MTSLGLVRLRHLSDRLHDNGKRCLFEFFREQVDQPASSLAENLERFASIDPAHLAVTGGDKHVHQLVVVSNDILRQPDEGSADGRPDESQDGGEAA